MAGTAKLSSAPRSESRMSTQGTDDEDLVLKWSQGANGKHQRLARALAGRGATAAQLQCT